MASETPLTAEAVSKQNPTLDPTSTLLCGAGIDASVAGPLAIGGANATSVVFTAPLTLPVTQSGTIQKRTVTIAFNNAALVAASTNGASATVNIGAILPTNARVLSVDLRALTAFSGGSASAVGIVVGSSGDIDALIASADVFAAAVDGGPATMTLGVRPGKAYLTATQLIATVTPDVGHKLSLLTAGTVIVDVLFTVLA